LNEKLTQFVYSSKIKTGHGGEPMLAILSDLHFQDTQNDVIRDDAGRILVDVDRNISAKAFKFIFDEFIDIANKVEAKELKIVLAGDVFDLNRSQTWFKDSVRPYGDHSVDMWLPIAQKILNDIVAANRATFDLFTAYARRTLDNGAAIFFTYIPGNHDRLINLHPDLRLQVRQLLGISTTDDSLFPHEIPLQDYSLHIRHGHEYDQSNFAGTVCTSGPLNCQSKDYDGAPLGDFVTIDIVTRIACEYRRRYEPEIKAGNIVHAAIYQKLLEFDDLRPTTDLISFMKNEIANSGKVLEKFFLPVVDTVLGDALNNDFLQKWKGRLRILGGKILRFLSTEALLNQIAKMDSEKQKPWEFAVREPDISKENTAFRYVVAGHTHNPDFVYLRKNSMGREQFFFDTGTWRQQIRKCEDEKTFARTKALTYAVFYSPKHDLCDSEREERFDYWSGYTKTV
jgi:hypothetical protein